MSNKNVSAYAQRLLGPLSRTHGNKWRTQRQFICIVLCLVLGCKALFSPRAHHRSTPSPIYQPNIVKRANTTSCSAKTNACHLVMSVYTRWQTLGDRLSHYQDLPEASSIVVIVNNLNLTLANLPSPNMYAVPVIYKFMEKNSMNNRFIPWPELTNECVVIIDDDIDADLAGMSQAITLWSKSGCSRPVGFLHCGRNHVHNDTTDEYVYCTKRRTKHGDFVASMILPGCGTVLNKKILELYTFATPQSARNLVDQTMNGDDLLLNFVAANHTGQCPIFLQASKGHVLSELSDSGLSSRKTHYEDRNGILNDLVSIFGKMPLTYSTSAFDSSNTVEGQTACSKTLPENYKC